MRRICALVMTLVLLCLPGLAGATAYYDDRTVVFTLSDDPDVLSLLSYIYDRVILKMEVIELPENTRYDDVTTAMEILTRTYPELCHLNNRWIINYYRQEPDIAVSLEPEYLDYSSMDYLIPVAKSIAGEAVGTQTEKAEALHDWLCERVTYDMSGGHTASAYGAIIDGWAQCEGYAKALVLLYRMAGIPSGLVTGYFYNTQNGGGSHAWVVAWIDGAWTLIDPTADDGLEQGVNHWYYGLTDEQMAVDHVVDENNILPICSSTALNWHARHGLMLSSMGEMSGLLRQFVLTRQSIDFRFADNGLFNAFYTQLDQLIEGYNEAAEWDEQFYGMYQVWVCPEQNGAMMVWAE